MSKASKSIHAKPVPDGREAIALVEVKTKKDLKGAHSCQDVKGIIINNENLNHSSCQKFTCCSDYKDLLLLPVCQEYSNKTRIDKVTARVYNPSSNDYDTLTVSTPDTFLQKHNHLLIPCNKKKSQCVQESVSYQFLTTKDLREIVGNDDKGYVFATGKSGGRQAFVQLKDIKTTTGQIVFENPQSSEKLNAYGPLVLGTAEKLENDDNECKYEVDAIGSYLLEKSGVSITLFGDGNDKECQHDGSPMNSERGDEKHSIKDKAQDEKPYLEEGVIDLHEKKGKHPEKLNATGPQYTVKRKQPSSDHHNFENAGATSSNGQNPEPNPSRPHLIMNSAVQPFSTKLCQLNKPKTPLVEYNLLPGNAYEASTQLHLERLTRQVTLLSEEFDKDQSIINKLLQGGQNGQEIENMIRRNTLRQYIVADMRESLVLVQAQISILIRTIQQYEERLKDKEKIEKMQGVENSRLREELKAAKKKIDELEKEKSDQKQPRDEIMAKTKALMEKSINNPDQATLKKLNENVQFSIGVSSHRYQNFRDRVSESSDDDIFLDCPPALENLSEEVQNKRKC